MSPACPTTSTAAGDTSRTPRRRRRSRRAGGSGSRRASPAAGSLRSDRLLEADGAPSTDADALLVLAVRHPAGRPADRGRPAVRTLQHCRRPARPPSRHRPVRQPHRVEEVPRAASRALTSHTHQRTSPSTVLRSLVARRNPVARRPRCITWAVRCSNSFRCIESPSRQGKIGESDARKGGRSPRISYV